MASILARAITPDNFISFDINSGTLLKLLGARADGGPRLKCFKGSVTLVAARMTHGAETFRIGMLILAICGALKVKSKGVGGTTWVLPLGVGDTAYEADASFFIQSFEHADTAQIPDLAVEIVVSHSPITALRAGAFLGISELWVYDVPQRKVTFHRLATKGKAKGTYQTTSWSRAFPVLTSADVSERMDDPEFEGCAFFESCQAWARRVLIPRLEAGNGGGR